MDFYSVVNNRRTIRDFKDEPIDRDTIYRIIEAGMKAPTNDHMRDWHFIVIDDKANMKQLIKKIPKKVSAKRVDFIMKSWRLNDECQQNMYKDAIPKQYQMLLNASCIVIPLFKQKKNLLQPKDLSALNGFASIWCCIENIFLAAAAEEYACALRIPLGDENEYVKSVLNFPDDYEMPCYIAIGKPADDAVYSIQKDYSIEDRIHINCW
ncbi:nitroreductase family protein [Konateibacter massiliensis]|uniref:nitroreductase family protein n=1 Tax=Konateibacter massiliensis TaxID=2002841 RepID=UPI000C146849|nr:nitroreductase family protein [Konateibacter massiliensis]